MIIEVVKKYLTTGLSVIPVTPDTKQPVVRWKEYQQRQPLLEEIIEYFKHENIAIALICGRVSGGVETIDIDNHFGNAPEVFNRWKELVTNTDPELLPKLVIESTQSGGYHILYRCERVEGNLKLAKKMKDNTQDTIIETRGEGGYVLVAPSKGYQLLQGKISQINYISTDERELLLAVSRSFNEIVETSSNKNVEISHTNRPGDDFNERGDVRPILIANRWTMLINVEEKEYWRRPGKDKGVSATFNYIPDKFYVFSSNAYPFEPGKAYDKFSVYTLLAHNGDYKAAVKELSQLGYGQKNGTHKANGTNRKVNKDEPMFTGKIALTDIGNAERFYNLYKGKVKYCHIQSKWYIWNNYNWEVDETGQVVELGKIVAKSIKAEAFNENDEEQQNNLWKWARTSQSAGKIEAMLKLAQSTEGIAAKPQDFDQDGWLLNLKNGVYDLKKNQLLKHDPKYMLSKLIDINYNKEAECIFWEDSLLTYFNNDIDQIRFVQKICGLTACGEHLEEVIFFLYGIGKNGKTVFTRVLEMIFQDYAQNALVDMLMVKNNDNTNTNDLARLKGARFVVTTELPRGKRLNENRVKDLTGGNKITARFLHKEYFEFQPTHSLWIVGNHKPHIHGGDEGIWRRIILIPFEVIIPDNERKPQNELMELFEQEKEGILKWIIEGWKLYQKEGLTAPKKIVEATKAYRDDQDILAGFIEDCCDTSSSIAYCKAKELQNKYKEWCEENNEVPLKSKSFYAALEERGFKRRDSGHGREKEFIGISLKKGLF
jgi:putative DNA primase/helicase